MSWWTDNRQNIIMTVVRWGLGYLLGRTASSLDPITQPPLTNDVVQPAQQAGNELKKGAY